VVRISSSDFCKSPVDLFFLSKVPEVEEEDEGASKNSFRGREYGGDSNE
jgi:hypothetical protein